MDALNKRIIHAVHEFQEQNIKAPVIGDIKKALGTSSVVYDRIYKLVKSNYLVKNGREVGVSIKGLALLEKDTPEVVMRESIPVREISTGWLCPRCGVINSPQTTQCNCK